MADQPTSSYLAKALANRQAGGSGVSSPYLAKSLAAKQAPVSSGKTFDLSGLGAAKNSSTTQSPLGWLVDILSRPMRAVENIPNQTLNEIQKVQTQGAQNYDLWGGIGNIITAPVRGFWSTNPADQPTGADLIEKTADVIGRANNSNYVDTQDNVNPWVKGIGGFGLDVGLDPLTYIPGAQIAKGGQLLTKGAKTAIEAADALVAGSNVGKALGAEARIAARAAKAEAATTASARAASDALNLELAAQKEALAGTAFGAPVVPKFASTIDLTKLEAKAATMPKTSDSLATILAKEQPALSAEEIKAFKASAAKEARAAKKAGATQDKATALLDSLGVAKGSTIPEQFAAKGVLPQIQEQLAKIAPTTVEVTPTVAKVAVTPNTAVTSQIADLEAQLARAKSKMAQTVSSPTMADRLDKQIVDIQTQLKGLRKQEKVASADLAATAASDAKAVKQLSASQALKNMLADPVQAAQLNKALGSPTVEKLAGIKTSQQLTKAVDALTRSTQGELKASSALHKDLAQSLYDAHDIKVPGTNVTAVSEVSKVDTPLVAEVAVEKAQGHTLVDAPSIWPGNYDPIIVEEVAADMPQWLKADFVNVQGMNHATGRGALSTSDIMGEGWHKFHLELNHMDQAKLMQSLLERDFKAIAAHNKAMKFTTPALMLAGEQRAMELYDRALQKMELAMRVMDRKGVPAWMGIDKANRVRLFTHQMLSSFKYADRDAMHLVMFNEATIIPTTNMMEAVAAIIKNPEISDSALLGILKKTENGATNFLTSEAKTARWKHYLNKPKSGLFEVNKENGKIKGYYGLVTKDDVAAQAIGLIRKTAPELRTVVAHNEDAAAKLLLAESKDLPKSLFEKLTRESEDPAAFGDFIRDTANPARATGEHAAENFVAPVIQPYVAKAATDYFPTDAIHNSQHIEGIQKAAMEWQKTDLKESLKRLGIEDMAYQQKFAKEKVSLRKDPLEGVGPDGQVIDEGLYEGAVAQEAMASSIENAGIATFKRLFQRSSGKETVIHDFDRASVTIHALNGRFYKEIQRLMEKHSTLVAGKTPMLTQAFRDIANGVDSATTAAARADLEPLIWTIFGNKQQNAIGIWQEAKATLDDIERYTIKNRVDFPIDKEMARKAAVDGDIFKAAMDQWRVLAPSVEDPMKFLADMHYAATNLLIDDTAANYFLKIPGATSRIAKSGYSKIGDIDPYAHPLLSRMPVDTRVNNEIIGEVKNLEEMLMQDLSPKSEFGKFINEKYVPMLNIWKKAVTIFRPGHHIRNLLSSEGIQYTVEGTKYYARSANASFKAMMVHKAYEGVSWSDLAKGMELKDMPKATDLLFQFGKKDITVADLYKAAEEHGLFTNFKHIEDLFDQTATTKFQDVMDKIALKGTKIEKAAGGLSEYQAHFSRLHHFTQVLMKQAKNGKNWDDAVRAAAIKIKRHHPDGLGLSNFEKQYIKPFIPFYSWTRQIVPIIAEGIVTNPGRFMQYPKASYNLAVAMGVNPQSMQDPFPTDQLFPKFITDQLTGPVANFGGNYFTAQPGYAYADILNQFVDPKRGLMTMVTPFIKVPGELLTGTKWDTGTRINDFSDYVDASIPGVNYLANFTGTSVTGSAVSVISGNGLDPQYAVSKGNKTPLDQGISVANWFTGMGVQNVSKKNLINLAEIEKRNAAAQAQKQKQGTARNAF